MKTTYKINNFAILFIFILSIFLGTEQVKAQGNDVLIDFTTQKWKLWLDEEAQWENDELFLPPVDLSEIPVNRPTIGWNDLYKVDGVKTDIPATVEEYFWGKNGNKFGISGNYIGVSWFVTSFYIPEELIGKRLILDFESCRLRAEVYVNEQLVGYDIINGTPFQANVSNAVKAGENKLAVRITDPNGNFAWRDWETFKWGKYDITPSHGFGGITGPVVLRKTDQSYIEDVFVKNTPEVTKIISEVTVKAQSKGKVTISYCSEDSGCMAKKEIEVEPREKAYLLSTEFVDKNAVPWTPQTPNLYYIETKWQGDDGSSHSFTRRFGFRWFDVQEKNGDKMFFLNGKRVFALTAISWGHWPVNGIYPTPELAKKQIQTAKDYGMNMLNFHRGIGQPIVLDYADEMGLMYYEEPGGYAPGQSDFTRAFKREKLLRMVKRDRNHPSLVIYNMINEAAMTLVRNDRLDPFPNELEDIQDAHKIDDTRIITYTSTFFSKKFHGGCPEGEAKFKMHMLPLSDEVLYDGWWDEHHAGGPGVYRDYFYSNPKNYLRFSDNNNEIVFYGEDGAIGTPPRLELLKEEYRKEGKTGWDGDTYLKMYVAFESFLKDNDFTEAFPSVDDLTTQMGNVSLYYQGRIIENCRIGNTVDGYAINGWENTKVENHSGIVDIYRNPKGDVQTLAKYNQPLYVSVKLRNKVVEKGSSVIADFYIYNEDVIQGKYTLNIEVKGSDGTLFTESKSVNVKGGDIYGQLLVEDVKFDATTTGYIEVDAYLTKNGETIAVGNDEIYSVYKSGVDHSVAVLDTSGTIQNVLEESNVDFVTVRNGFSYPDQKILLVGEAMQPGMVPGNFKLRAPILEWVQRGNTLVFIDNADFWADYLNLKEIVDYRGSRKLDRNWFGGHYFNRKHPVFTDLPQNTVLNWEYQSIAGYDKDRFGMRFENGECIVGCYADHNHEMYSAFQVIPSGKGQVVITSLDLVKAVQDKQESSVVAEKIIQNICKFWSK